MTKLTVDRDLIETLAQLLERNGLTEIELADGESRVRLVRGAQAARTPAPALAVAPPAAASEAPREGVVTSPMVGTVYLAPEPGAAPFVSVGATIKQGQTLLIVEAMKVMNPIRAPKAGTVVEVLARNAAPVEFGEPLIVIG